MLCWSSTVSVWSIVYPFVFRCAWAGRASTSPSVIEKMVKRLLFSYFLSGTFVSWCPTKDRKLLFSTILKLAPNSLWKSQNLGRNGTIYSSYFRHTFNQLLEDTTPVLQSCNTFRRNDWQRRQRRQRSQRLGTSFDVGNWGKHTKGDGFREKFFPTVQLSHALQLSAD